MRRVALITGGGRGIGAATARLAQAILWLLSDEASYTTGAFMDVTGGK